MLDIPTEILRIIAGTLKVGEVSAFARTNRNLYHKLRLVLIEYSIKNLKSSALHWAAKTDDYAYAKTLLFYGANVNALVDGLSPLMTAAEHNSERVTQLLLKNRKLHVNKRNGEGKTALWHGVANKSSAAVHWLLQHRRIKINHSNREGQTVLWLAVIQEDRDLVCRLLAQGANPDTKDQGGISPWIEACLRNRNSIKDLLLDHCKATSPVTFPYDMAPSRNEETVSSAASNGDLATLRKLLLRGEEVDVVNHQGQTPLHLAARGGHLAVVGVLLRQANSLLNRKDHHDRTALWFSTYSSYDGVTNRLLEEGDVDVNTLGRDRTDDVPSTSLHHLTIRRDATILRRLLAVPALDPNTCARSNTPLCKAIEEGNTAVMRLLLAHEKTQINAIDLYTDAPLFLATQGEHVDMVRLLVDQGDRLEVNQLSRSDGETALCMAIRRGRLDVMDILLKHPRINLDIMNRWGETASVIAVKQGHTAMVGRLIQGPTIPCNMALAADLASSGKNRDVELLIKEKLKEKLMEESNSSYLTRQCQLQLQASRVGLAHV
jgi:ankyrin repeat protein